MADETTVVEEEVLPPAAAEAAAASAADSVDDGSVSKEILDDIDAGVESAGKDADARTVARLEASAEPGAADAKPKTISKEEVVVDEEVDETVMPAAATKKDEAVEDLTKTEKVETAEVIPSSIDDSQLERAFKVGLSVADARKLPDAASLESVLTLLEAKTGDGGGEGGEGDEVVTDVKNLLAGFPEFSEDDYDPKLVAALNALKSVVEPLLGKVDALESAQANTVASVYESKVGALGEAYQTAMKTTPQKAVDLKDKFEILAGGYKAAGKEVDSASVFDEAVALVMGDIATESKTTIKTEELKKRETQHIQKPAGSSSKPKGDASEDIAAEIDRNHFGKK